MHENVKDSFFNKETHFIVININMMEIQPAPSACTYSVLPSPNKSHQQASPSPLCHKHAVCNKQQAAAEEKAHKLQLVCDGWGYVLWYGGVLLNAEEKHRGTAYMAPNCRVDTALFTWLLML